MPWVYWSHPLRVCKTSRQSFHQDHDMVSKGVQTFMRTFQANSNSFFRANKFTTCSFLFGVIKNYCFHTSWQSFVSRGGHGFYEPKLTFDLAHVFGWTLRARLWIPSGRQPLMCLSVLMSEVTSKDSKVKLNQATRCLLGRLTKFTIYFLQLILNVRVNNRKLWQFMFHEVYYNRDSQNSFSVYHDSLTPMTPMVDHGVTKIPPPPPPTPPL